ncbi:hypothetical protein NKJ50_31860, partial [Mesorhizobium sp. M0115]|uniref:hypothetical protein n=1 Tax=unclassified Mesorhizobium TaxID=325217 RepID=UPI003336724E
DPVRRRLRRKVRQPMTKPASRTEFLTVPTNTPNARLPGSNVIVHSCQQEAINAGIILAANLGVVLPAYA